MRAIEVITQGDVGRRKRKKVGKFDRYSLDDANSRWTFTGGAPARGQLGSNINLADDGAAPARDEIDPLDRRVRGDLAQGSRDRERRFARRDGRTGLAHPCANASDPTPVA